MKPHRERGGSVVSYTACHYDWVTGSERDKTGGEWEWKTLISWKRRDPLRPFLETLETLQRQRNPGMSCQWLTWRKIEEHFLRDQCLTWDLWDIILAERHHHWVGGRRTCGEISWPKCLPKLQEMTFPGIVSYTPNYYICFGFNILGGSLPKSGTPGGPLRKNRI